jgi:hypothetical protein
LSGLPPSLQIGEKIAVRMHQERTIIEQAPGRSR